MKPGLVVAGIVAICVAAFAVGHRLDPNRREAAARRWIEETAVRLKASEAGRGFEDLAPLKAMIGAARIVGLGEATHGTRETFQMKHRLVEFLVVESGFTLFAIEANMPEAHELDAYVKGAPPPAGGVEALIAGMKFWTWETEEVRAMVEWMRAYNAGPARPTGGRKIGFAGFDMQFPDFPARRVQQYVEQTLPGHAALVQGGLDVLRRIRAGDAVAEWERILSALESSPAPAGEDGAWAVQNARVVVQALRDRAGTLERDEAMADNVAWLRRRHPDEKIILWAHNGHIATHPARPGAYRSMGTHLRERAGGDYVAVGFAVGHGSYRARSVSGGTLGEFPLEPPRAGSVEILLEHADLDLALLDLRPARSESSPGHLLAEPRYLRSIGALKVTGQFVGSNASEQFDLLIWQRHTTAARGLPEIIGGSAADLQRKGDLDAAAETRRREAEADPTQFNLQELGAIELLRGNVSEATATFERIIASWPGRAGGFLNRGAIRQAIGDSEGALADFDLALTKTGNTPLAEIHRALELQRLGRGAPNGQLLQAMSGWTNDWPVQMGRFASGSLPEAEFLSRARVTDPASASGQQIAQADYLAGLKQLAEGDPEKARASFARAATAPSGGLHSGLAAVALKRLGSEGANRSQ